MTDKVEVVSDEVMAEFAVVNGGSVPYVVTELKANEQSTHPRVAWIEHGGRFGPLRENPTTDDSLDGDASVAGATQATGSIGTWHPNITVECWGQDIEAARTLLERVVLATTRVARRWSFVWSTYEGPEQGHKSSGAIFRAELSIEFEVPAYPPAIGRQRQMVAYTFDATANDSADGSVHVENPEE